MKKAVDFVARHSLALGAFYSSHLYAALSDSATGLWRAPTRSLVAFFDEERRTGHLPLNWSE